MTKKALPRYKKCFICGKENKIGLNTIFYHDEKEVYTEVKIGEDYAGYDNIIHGGIIAALLDETAMWACFVKTGKMYFTIELNIKYKKKLRPDLDAKIIGKLIRHKKSYAISESRLVDMKGNVYATATGTYFPVSGKEADKIWDYLYYEEKDKF